MLYQPSQKWRMGAAFGAAALIHFAAIALAYPHQHDQAKESPSGDDAFPSINIITETPTDSQASPPDVIDPLPTPNPTEGSIPDERPTPPPVPRHTTTLAVPIAKMRTSVTGGSQSLSLARISAVSAPRPEYPYEARRQKITGNGIVVMTIDFVSGRVTDVIMEESTGSLVLDNATMIGFRRWRFKPGTVSTVRSPITFTMTGAQY
jgi:periplasmic protein TonB